MADSVRRFSRLELVIKSSCRLRSLIYRDCLILLANGDGMTDDIFPRMCLSTDTLGVHAFRFTLSTTSPYSDSSLKRYFDLNKYTLLLQESKNGLKARVTMNTTRKK